MAEKLHKENKKIKNAHPLEYKGIKFKSQLERMTYTTFKEKGFPIKYEPEKFILWEGFYPSVPFYNKDRKSRMLKLEKKKVLPISYTPDFIFKHNGYLIVIEAKGLENDVFPIKKKLFRCWLEKYHPKSIYFEVYSKKQVLQAVDIINNLK